MKRILIVVCTAACLLSLTACGVEPPVAEVSPEPAATSTASPTPPPTPAETSAPEPPVPAVFALPSCDELFTRAELDDLMGTSLVPADSTGRVGSAFPDIRDRIVASSPTNCTWARPVSERGVVISMVAADAAFHSGTADLLASLSFSPTGSPAGPLYSGEGLDTLDYTEAHVLADGVWVAVVDVNGGSAAAIALRIAARVAALNP